MQDSEIHSILFRGVIARLNSLSGTDGRHLHDSNESLPFEFYIAYQKRPNERFAHNYERDKFLHHRDKYSMLNHEGSAYVVAELKQGEHVTIYKRPIELAFGRDGNKAFEMLERLMHKFYDKVEIADLSPVTRADYNATGNNENAIRVNNEH